MNEDASATARALMARLTPGTPQPALSAEIERCPCPEEARAGMYLINGEWERAHKACQDLQSDTAAYWHALVHRHEPDYGNSKYWLRRVGDSPVHRRLLKAAEEAGKLELVAPEGSWDPVRFTDRFAERAHDGWTRKLDALEMEALLEQSFKP